APATPPSCGPDCHAGRVSGLQARSERAQLDPAECMTERALDLDLAGGPQRACALGELTLGDRVQIVEIDERSGRQAFRPPHHHLLRDSPDRGGDFRDEHLVQVGIGRVPRQKEDRPAPHWEWQARPPDLVLLHRRLRPRDTGGFRSQTRGSNQASSALSGTLRYASAVARSRSSRIAFWMAARMKAERRRDRAGAICSSFLNVSSSTSTSNCFICYPIRRTSAPHKISFPPMHREAK